MTKFCHLKYFWLLLHLYWTLGSVLSQDQKNEGTVDDGSSYFFHQQPDYPRDCTEAIRYCSTSNLSGVYLIKPDGYPEPFEVYCDNAIDLGGYTVIQRSQDDSLLFNRNWTECKSGFGFLSQGFWIGLDKLSFLTNQKFYELRIDVTSIDGLSFYITYNRFRISDEYSEYKLTSVGEYSGTEATITAFLCPSSSEDVNISVDCMRRCSCTSDGFVCSNEYRCSSNAVCVARDEFYQCKCKTGYTGDGINCTPEITPTDCRDVYNRISNSSGVFAISPFAWTGEPFDVYCDMTDGGGWTVFQRRVNGSEDFYLYWADYKNGFGTPTHEHWLGNDRLHSLTSQKNYELRVDLVNRNDDSYFAKYEYFRVSAESDNYSLSLGDYSEGNAGDSLSYHNGQAFTTRDNDNDRRSNFNCASDLWPNNDEYFHGAWWFNNCAHSCLNCRYGTYFFYWYDLPGEDNYLKHVDMKIRPV